MIRQQVSAAPRPEPETLAEIKAALGHDTNRFARAVARPIVVERLLRSRFENDDTLHLPLRREAEHIRERLLAAKSQGASVAQLLPLLKAARSNDVTETIWQLGGRPAETRAPDVEWREAQKRFGPQAQILSSPRSAEPDRGAWLADLPPALQNVLRVQLRQAGDVSAVVEMPAGFVLYLATAKTSETLAVAALSLPKRSYEEWLRTLAINPPEPSAPMGHLPLSR